MSSAGSTADHWVMGLLVIKLRKSSLGMTRSCPSTFAGKSATNLTRIIKYRFETATTNIRVMGLHHRIIWLLVAVKIVYWSSDYIQRNIIYWTVELHIVIVRSPHLSDICPTSVNYLWSTWLFNSSSIHDTFFEKFGICWKCAWNFSFIRSGWSACWRQKGWSRARNLIIFSFRTISSFRNSRTILIMCTLLTLNISFGRLLWAGPTSTADCPSRICLAHGVGSAFFKFVALVESVSHRVFLLQF